ncbi:GNAT family N-acetyltransferase [Angustibacter luteus]|uniref:GNAT family N-acetyltransferase n=1 Tax=Angustibacter luteus TaxID=658456 RepID=A0ABW1JFE8_9ACTN
MSEVTVRALDGDDWNTYRGLRLAALQDAPDAFASSYEDEQAYDEAFWRLRMGRSARLVAESDEEAVGIVSVGQAREHDVAELFGMWVVPGFRGKGVAWQLTQAAGEHARREGQRALKLWVSTDNGRAVAFFSSAGFRPADERRAMTNDADVEELAMVLPLGDDPGWVPTTTL